MAGGVGGDGGGLVLEEIFTWTFRGLNSCDPFFSAAKHQKQQKKSVFDEELTNTSKKALKKYRAG